MNADMNAKLEEASTSGGSTRHVVLTRLVFLREDHVMTAKHASHNVHDVRKRSLVR
jgi:hypothetical protein